MNKELFFYFFKVIFIYLLLDIIDLLFFCYLLDSFTTNYKYKIIFFMFLFFIINVILTKIILNKLETKIEDERVE